MSLDFYLERTQPTEVFSANITHNLGKMADAAGIYDALWHPERLPDVKVAGDLVPRLEAGLALLESYPDRFRTFDAPNGWGKYNHFVPFVQDVLNACRKYPDATVRTST